MRAQISMYLILGLVLLILFAGLFWFSSFVRSAIGGGDENTIVTNTITGDEINSYVDNCLERTAQDKLYWIGLQSGHLFPKQGGTSKIAGGILYQFADVEQLVPFGLRQSDVSPSPPSYPKAVGNDLANNYRYTLSAITQGIYANRLWGKITLPKLCSFFGQGGVQSYACATYYLNNTIQDELANAVEEEVAICLSDFSESLNELTESISYSEPDVHVVLSDEDVRFTLYLNLTFKTAAGTTTADKYIYTAPVRLKKIYNLAHYILTKDANDVYFDKEKDYSNLRDCKYKTSLNCWDTQMGVGVLRNPQPGAHPGSDILQIVDNASTLKGKPFVFLTGIENRAPMLEYIHRETGESYVDMNVSVDGTISFFPIAYDADEDDLIFRYSGWKSRGFETSIAYVNRSFCDGSESKCAFFTAYDITDDLKTIDVYVYDEGNLYDYQPVIVRVGELAKDIPAFFPPRPTGLQDDPCNPKEAKCFCSGSTVATPSYCEWEETKPMDCDIDSVCYHDISSGGSTSENTVTCDAATCYQKADNADIAMICTNGATCVQYATNGTLSMTCRGGSNCVQETAYGYGTTDCFDSYCRQETNVGQISMATCSPGPQRFETQGDTLIICE